MASSSDESPRIVLEEISTRWPLIRDPALFVRRYAPAIEGYLTALVRDPHLVEDIRQDFLVRVLEKGLVDEDKLKGRFRYYLKASVRNAALSHLRKKGNATMAETFLSQIAAPDEPDSLEAEFDDQWRRCVLDRVWDALEMHERQAKDNHAHTVLRLFVQHAHADSEQLATCVSEAIGKPMRADAYRKQLSRARRLFARLLVQEVVQTIESPTPERIEEELRDAGILAMVERFLPPDWRDQVGDED